MRREERFSDEGLKEMRSKNYGITIDMANKLNQMKGYIAGYSNPQKGVLLVNYNGQNYLVDIEPVGTMVNLDNVTPEESLRQAMKEYGFMFKDEREVK